MFNSVLIVCTGNICRSPMAEFMLRDRTRDFGIKVASAGTSAVVGSAAHPETERVLKEHGLSSVGHRAQQITPDLVRDFDLILAMESEHRTSVQQAIPFAHGRVYLAGHWRDEEIPDPFTQPAAAYDAVWDSLDGCLDDWVEKLRR